jgi:cytochrome c peroxidase
MSFRLAVLVVGLSSLAGPAISKTITVHRGDSIQAAVDAARPGDTVAVRPGTYHEAGRACPTEPGNTCAVVISKDDISLVGLGTHHHPVILENPGGQDQGIAIAKPGTSGARCLSSRRQRIDGALVQGFTVRGFDGDGIFLLCVDDWWIEDNTASDNAEYGIFPSHCGSGRLTNNVATGANDTGIYIGQSHDARVDHNLATGNVSGFELENSRHIRMDHNESTGNTAGLLSFAMPGLDVKVNDRNRIDHNDLHDNNKPNTCLGGDVCLVPQGSGLLLVGADHNEVEHNTITGNNSFGIGMVNVCLGFGLTPAECAAVDVDPNPDGNEIEDNVVTGNGSSPDPTVAPVFAVDLAWDTTGADNCWEDNTAGTQFPPALPVCP